MSKVKTTKATQQIPIVVVKYWTVRKLTDQLAHADVGTIAYDQPRLVSSGRRKVDDRAGALPCAGLYMDRAVGVSGDSERVTQ